MEYVRDQEQQIYRDFAGRLGKLATQYQSLRQNLGEHENYGATLTISLLHPLLAIYTEIRKRHKSRHFPEFNQPLVDIPSSYGLRLSMIKSFTCFHRFAKKEDVSFHFVLESIRDALSHPCPVIEEVYQRTGYETIVGSSGLIESYRFIQSTDVRGDNGRPRTFVEAEIERELKKIDDLNPYHGIMIQPVPSSNSRESRFQLIDSEGQVLVRRMVIEVPLGALKTLVVGLSDYLGRPIEEMVSRQFNQPRVVGARG